MLARTEQAFILANGLMKKTCKREKQKQNRAREGVSGPHGCRNRKKRTRNTGDGHLRSSFYGIAQNASSRRIASFYYSLRWTCYTTESFSLREPVVVQ